MSATAGWDLGPCIERLRAFRDARTWDRFHNPKDLAAALAIEAGELQELFLWKGAAEAEVVLIDGDQRRRVEGELADVVIFALYLADRLGCNLATIVLEKVTANEARYEVEHHRGVARKADPLTP